MKAIVYRAYGGPDVLHVEEIETPCLNDDEVLIKVHAVEVTKSDCEMRKSRFAVKWFWLPLRIALGVFRPKRRVLGGYFAGEITAVGRKVSRFSVGDQVFATARMHLGAYAEYLCLPADYTIVSKPTNIDYAQAAAIPFGGLNALHFMRRAQIRPGDKVLINGAGGSIGIYSVQIAKAMGGEVTVVDKPVKEALLREAGADHFIDYIKSGIADSSETYDVIFNMVACSRYADFIRLLNPGGRYVMGNPTFAAMLRSFVTPFISGKQVIFAFAGEKVEELVELKAMLEQGKLKAIIDSVYCPEQIAAAQRRVENEDRSGIVIVSFDRA